MNYSIILWFILYFSELWMKNITLLSKSMQFRYINALKYFKIIGKRNTNRKYILESSA